MDRALKNQLTEGLKAANRIADSLEKLVNEPLVKLESPPPQCPHCGVINPKVQIDQSNEVGNIAEFILDCICQNCGKELYGVVEAWVLLPDRRSAINLGTQIAEGVKNGGTVNA